MWGPGAAGGFQNALAMGLQFGQMAGRAKRQREERNALSAYAQDPSEANFGALANARPDIAIRERERMQAAQQEQKLGELTQRALGGDEAALGELATVNFDRWKALSGEQKAEAKREAEIYGNAAMDVLSLPLAQRSQRIMGYAQQLGSQEIAQIAQLPPDQQEQALRAAVAEAGMVQRLIEMERPSYMAIPEGGTLVNTRDPGAVSQFGGQAPMQRGQPSGQVMNFEAFKGMQVLGPERAARQVAKLVQGGVVFAVNSPEEARQLPSGTPILLPDGTQGRVP